ncbi:MAG TPA: DUF1464 family protein, partial [Geobacterales bacterium]|nr:DUF1464 family protein [Geobacterales bacterium]
KDTDFILLEMGYAYNACIGVKKGRIIDAIGGTNSTISFKSLGAMDGEVAYLISPFDKQLLFKGGICDLVGSENPEDMMRNEEAKEAFFEGIEKMVACTMVSTGYPREILISGRLSNYEDIFEEVRLRLRKYSKVRKIIGLSKKVKTAAQGAAILANGLAGGIFKKLIENMEIERSNGTVLDHVKIFKAKEIMKKLKAIS